MELPISVRLLTSIYTLYCHIAFHYDYYLLFLKEGIEISLLYLDTRQCDNQVSINNSLHPLKLNWDKSFYYPSLTCLVQMCRLMIFIWSQWPCFRRLTSLKIQVEKDGKFYLQSTKESIPLCTCDRVHIRIRLRCERCRMIFYDHSLALRFRIPLRPDQSRHATEITNKQSLSSELMNIPKILDLSSQC